MKPIRDTAASLLRRWRRKKVVTLPELMAELRTSLRTLRRRLKSWGALASFNHNSRFYTLPDLPRFDCYWDTGILGRQFRPKGRFRGKTVFPVREDGPIILTGSATGFVPGLIFD